MNSNITRSFVTFGEVMIRDCPADFHRLERTRQVYLSPAGTEFSVAVGVSRLGGQARFISRLPDNPYGRMVEGVGRENGVDMSHLVWAPRTEPIGRYLYEIGCSPRPSSACYQRMYSAASKLEPSMVDWSTALRDAKFLHISGISFGLASHSGYSRNFLGESFEEAVSKKPKDCLVGLDFNYRGTLWSIEEVRNTLAPMLEKHVDILITSVEDMAQFFNISCGKLSPTEVLSAKEPFSDDDVQAMIRDVKKRFDLKLVAFTKRYADSNEEQRWEAMAGDGEKLYFRSPSILRFKVIDRLGGGDAWDAGFYATLLELGLSSETLSLAVRRADAAMVLQQTLMFDLPILNRAEVDSMLSTSKGRDVNR